MGKRKMTKRDLEVILANIFEHLPEVGEDRDVTWEKVGYIQAMCWKGLLGEAFFDFGKSGEDLDRETQQVIASLRKGEQ